MKVLISTVLLVISITLLTSQAQAQNSSVAIGDATPKTNAVLYLRSPGGNQGLIIPVVGNTGNFGEAGMIVYNSGDQKVYFHNGNDWAALGSGGGSGGNYTLEMAGNNLLLKQGTTTVSTVPLASATPTTANQFLTWDGSKWVATTFTQDAANVNGSITVNGLKGKALPALPSTTQVLVYNGSAWVFQTLTGGTDSQDLSLNSTTNILSLTNDATTVDLNTYKQNLGLTGTGSAATGESFPLTISSGTGVAIREGTNVQIDQSANVLTINSVAGGAGTVTNVSVANANGFNGTVSNATTTPAITLTTSVTGIMKGNGTAISAAVAGTDYLTPNGSAASLTGFPTFNQNTTGTASTITGNIAQSQVTNLTTDLSNKVTGNTAITAGTNTKITYDAKGLVTAGAALTVADLPVMTATTGGAVPLPPNNTTTFLRGDGTFAAPSASGWALTGNAGTAPATNFLGTTDAQDMVFRSNNVEAMRISTSGNIGIGTNAPSSLLHLNNAAAGSNFMKITNQTSALGMSIGNSGSGGREAFVINNENAAMYFQTNALNRMAISASGNVGIGTIAPNAPLQFASTAALRKIVLFEQANNDHQFIGFGVGPSGTLNYQVILFNDHVFLSGLDATTSTELMRIKGDGNVGIGINPTQKLDVAGNVKFSGSLLPNDLAGTAGQVLASAGAGLPPIWTNPTGTTLINNTGLHNLYAGVSVSTSGQDNAFYGYEAGKVNTGSQNTFVGANAGSEKTNGGLSTFMGWYAGNRATGGANTFIGAQAGGTVTTGNVNTFIGEKAGLGTTTGSQNVIVGSQAGQANISGTQLVLIGQTANVGDDDLINAVAIGYGAVVNANNTMVFGTSSTTGWGLGTQPVAGRAVVVGTAATNGNGAYLTTGGVWTNASDRNKKENFTELNTSEILEKVKLLSVTRWNYKGDPSTVTHIGPMAQDFYSLFKTGDDDKSISTIDPSGVALLSIQELIKKIEELEIQNQKLSAEKGVLEAKVTSIEDQHKSLMEDVQELKRILGAEAKNKE